MLEHSSPQTSLFSARKWLPGLYTQEIWPKPVVLSPTKPRDRTTFSRFFPFETEHSKPSRHLSFSPITQRVPTPVPMEPKAGDLNELKTLIELSFRNKRQHKLSKPVTSQTKNTTEMKENRESLSDTIDSQVLNVELHYQENLTKAGQVLLTAIQPKTKGCPLQALQSIGRKRPRRNPLPLHGVVIGGPGKVGRVDRRPDTMRLTARKRPMSLYRKCAPRDIARTDKNSECLRIRRLPSVYPGPCVPPLTSTVSSHIVPLGMKSTESEESDSDPLVSRHNLTVQ